MPKTDNKRKAKEYHTIRKKMRKLEKRLEQIASSDSDSTDTGSTEGSDSSLDDREILPPPEKASLAQLLGANPAEEKEVGPDLEQELAVRWKNYLTHGLEKEEKSKLLERWKLPQNCTTLRGPSLNPEVSAMLTPADLKKDAFLLDIQTNLGKGLTALGTALTSFIQTSESEEPDPRLTDIVQSGMLLCDGFYTLTNHRKFLLYPHFNPKVQKVVAKQTADEFLFGEDFAEKCKTAKSLETSVKELKAGPSSSKNFKPAASKTRWKSEKPRGGQYNRPYQSTNQRQHFKYRDNKKTWNKKR